MSETEAALWREDALQSIQARLGDLSRWTLAAAIKGGKPSADRIRDIKHACDDIRSLVDLL